MPSSAVFLKKTAPCTGFNSSRKFLIRSKPLRDASASFCLTLSLSGSQYLIAQSQSIETTWT
jgi:hypothetical protein